MRKIIGILFLLCLSACGGGGGTNTPGTPGVITHNISGTVTASGAALAGTAVALSGAGTGAATTDAGGNYSFTGVQNGSYTVTAAKAGYVITPATLSVTVSNANATGKNFTAAAAVATRSWGTATQIDTGSGGGASYPQVAFDASGNAEAVWYQANGAQYNVWSNSYTAASGLWGTAALVNTAPVSSTYAPQVATDPAGNAVAVWQQSDGTRYNIWANSYTAATGTWGTAVLIETDNAGDAQNPQVAVDPSGNAVAVWQQSDGTRFNIWSNRYSFATGLWGTAGLIETDNAGDALYPQVAVDPSGNAVAVWYQTDGTRFNIWSNRYRAATGAWGTAALIETDNAGNAYYPQVAVDPFGNALAVWQQSDGTRYNIWSNRYNATTGVWGTATLIETDNTGNAFDPRLAIDKSGNAVAVWEQSDGTRYNIWSNRYNAATGVWGTAGLIETNNAGDALYPQVAINATGIAVAVWQQTDGTRYGVWANAYR